MPNREAGAPRDLIAVQHLYSLPVLQEPGETESQFSRHKPFNRLAKGEQALFSAKAYCTVV